MAHAHTSLLGGGGVHLPSHHQDGSGYIVRPWKWNFHVRFGNHRKLARFGCWLDSFGNKLIDVPLPGSSVTVRRYLYFIHQQTGPCLYYSSKPVESVCSEVSRIVIDCPTRSSCSLCFCFGWTILGVDLTRSSQVQSLIPVLSADGRSPVAELVALRHVMRKPQTLVCVVLFVSEIAFIARLKVAANLSA